MWTFKMYSRNTKTTNEPTASNNKSERPQVKIWNIWKTSQYLNINDSFHLKDLEISKYKRESKGRWPIYWSTTDIILISYWYTGQLLTSYWYTGQLLSSYWSATDILVNYRHHTGQLPASYWSLYLEPCIFIE
jgi:hypothetical protein